MPSTIDPSVPITGNPTTQSVRDNFTAAVSDFNALETTVDALVPVPAGTETGQTMRWDGSSWVANDSLVVADNGRVDVGGPLPAVTDAGTGSMYTYGGTTHLLQKDLTPAEYIVKTSFSYLDTYYEVVGDPDAPDFTGTNAYFLQAKNFGYTADEGGFQWNAKGGTAAYTYDIDGVEVLRVDATGADLTGALDVAGETFFSPFGGDGQAGVGTTTFAGVAFIDGATRNNTNRAPLRSRAVSHEWSVGSESGNQVTVMQLDALENVIMPQLPTTAAGLPSNALWNDGGTLKIAP